MIESEFRDVGGHRLRRSDVFACVTCKSEWFQVIKACKISSAIQSAYFQLPGEITFHYVLKCCKCNDFQELPIQESTGNQSTQDEYRGLIETLSQDNKTETKSDKE